MAFTSWRISIFELGLNLRPLEEREKVRMFGEHSQGNLPMQAALAIVKFRGRGTRLSP